MTKEKGCVYMAKEKVKCVYCEGGKNGWVCIDCLGQIVYGKK